METNTIEEALESLRQGEFVVVLDDKDRENEGDLIIAADKVTEEKIGFMVRHTSGLICVSVKREQLEHLQIPLMCLENSESFKTAFTISVDYSHGTSSGISAHDRAATILALNNPLSKKDDFRRPGHIFPLRYQEGGVIKRPGHTEAAMDLSILAGLSPMGVLCELVNDDGSMSRGKQIADFAKKYQLKVITIHDLIEYRLKKEFFVKKLAESTIPTQYGNFQIFSYSSDFDMQEHIVLTKGNVKGKDNVLVRIHSECLTGDILGSLRCDCGNQISLAMKMIEEKGEGIIIYMRGHEGRGIGITQKLKAYQLQDQGLDTVDANLKLGHPPDQRNYVAAAHILKDLEVRSISVLTNNPTKVTGLEGYSFKIANRIPLRILPTVDNLQYLRTKQEKMGHLLNLSR